MSSVTSGRLSKRVRPVGLIVERRRLGASSMHTGTGVELRLFYFILSHSQTQLNSSSEREEISAWAATTPGKKVRKESHPDRRPFRCFLVFFVLEELRIKEVRCSPEMFECIQSVSLSELASAYLNFQVIVQLKRPRYLAIISTYKLDPSSRSCEKIKREKSSL